MACLRRNQWQSRPILFPTVSDRLLSAGYTGSCTTRTHPNAPRAQERAEDAGRSAAEAHRKSGLAGARRPSQGPTREGSAAQRYGRGVVLGVDEVERREGSGDTYAARYERQAPEDVAEDTAWVERYATRLASRRACVSQDDGSDRPAEWWVTVKGPGHGCRPGQKMLDRMPDALKVRGGEVMARHG